MFNSMHLSLLSALVLLLSCIAGSAVAHRNEVKRMAYHTVKEVVLPGSKPMHEIYCPADLPRNWDWRNVGGTSYVTQDLNQHIPTYCGSCWAFASMSALADRIKIVRRAQFPDIQASIQAILNCATGKAGSCYGGDAGALYQWVHENGVPELTCQLYEAVDNTCDPIHICRNCDHDGTCFPVKNYPTIHVEQYGQISGEEQMMAEIYARGPIACDVNCDPLQTYSGGILLAPNVNHTNHVVSVSGWGVSEDGIKYWIVRNSWGTYWGEHGWFRIVRGINNILIESHCAWATPKMPVGRSTVDNTQHLPERFFTATS